MMPQITLFWPVADFGIYLGISLASGGVPCYQIRSTDANFRPVRPDGRPEPKLKEHIVQQSLAIFQPGATLKLLMGVMFTAIFTLVLSGCGSNQPGTQVNTPSLLYDALGGQDRITQISETFLGNVAADDRINGLIAKSDTSKLLSQLTDLLCEETGGPQVYTGPDPFAASQGLHITDDQWDAAVEDLNAAMKTLKVPDTTQAGLLGIVEPMKTDVVGH
jgi:hemoglobin